MEIHRNPMEKILKQAEDNTVITNPKESGKTFLRKMMYLSARWKDRIKRVFSRQ